MKVATVPQQKPEHDASFDNLRRVSRKRKKPTTTTFEPNHGSNEKEKRRKRIKTRAMDNPADDALRDLLQCPEFDILVLAMVIIGFLALAMATIVATTKRRTLQKKRTSHTHPKNSKQQMREKYSFPPLVANVKTIGNRLVVSKQNSPSKTREATVTSKNETMPPEHSNTNECKTAIEATPWMEYEEEEICF